MRPIGTVGHYARNYVHRLSARLRVLIGPGLTTLDRIRRSTCDPECFAFRVKRRMNHWVHTQELHPRQIRLSRPFKNLRSPPSSLNSLKIQVIPALKRLAAAVRFRPWPPSFQKLGRLRGQRPQSARSPVNNLMTGCIVLKIATSQHRTQKFATLRNLLKHRIIVESVIAYHILPGRRGILGINKIVAPGT